MAAMRAFVVPQIKQNKRDIKTPCVTKRAAPGTPYLAIELILPLLNSCYQEHPSESLIGMCWQATRGQPAHRPECMARIAQG